MPALVPAELSLHPPELAETLRPVPRPPRASPTQVYQMPGLPGLHAPLDVPG